jgi:cyclophilin family peptidyl-prolyl cis-trans isomerase
MTPKALLLAPYSLLLVSACKSGPPPEPKSRTQGIAEPVKTAAAATQSAAPAKTAPPEPPPAPTARGIAAKPVAQVPVSEGDPVKGKFSLEDATKGLPGQGKLVAEMKTDKGTLECELYADKAPITVANFVGLARGLRPWKTPAGDWVKKPLYDGTPFHRIIKGFMIQGGDPLTKDEANKSRWGTGGPGHQIKAEFNDKPHLRGVLSMARSNDPNSAGSQFFICHGEPRFLDKQYTAFGRLIEGDEVLEKIGTTQTLPGDRPVKRMNVESVKIVTRDLVK